MQMAMRWREDGAQLAVGLHNKMVVTVWAGGIVQEGKGKLEDERLEWPLDKLEGQAGVREISEEDKPE